MITPRLAPSLLALSLCLVAPACASAQPPSPAEKSSTPPTAASPKAPTEDGAETLKLLRLFASAFEQVREQYVEPVKDEELVEAAINGMLTHLDPHSNYMNRDEWKDMQVQTRGEFGGLGIEVTMENGAVKVISPIDDTPASRAGIQAGDLVVELDGQAVMGLNLQEAVNKMRGPVGTKIRLTVVRQGAGEPLSITITRAIIKVESVKWRPLGKVGYVRISSFNERTQDGLKRAIDDLNKKLGADLEGWVLDLRNNPGGLLEQAVWVSDSFLESGDIVSTRTRDPENIQKVKATPGDLAAGKPIVVLINAGSASASEIVAGALQDNHRAIVLGLKSFGKGSVQTVLPVPGYGAIKLTTARYYTPSGRSIQAEGITPDIEVQPAKVELLADKGLSFRESNLYGALNNDHPGRNSSSPGGGPTTPAPVAPASPPGAPAPTSPTAPNPSAPSTPGTPGAPGTQGTPGTPGAAVKPGETDPAEDFQLARALDLIHGLWVYDKAQSDQKKEGAPVLTDAALSPAPPSASAPAPTPASDAPPAKKP